MKSIQKMFLNATFFADKNIIDKTVVIIPHTAPKTETVWVMGDLGASCDEACIGTKMLTWVDSMPNKKRDFEWKIGYEYEGTNYAKCANKIVHCDKITEETHPQAPDVIMSGKKAYCTWRSSYLINGENIYDFASASHEQYRRLCPCQG